MRNERINTVLARGLYRSKVFLLLLLLVAGYRAHAQEDSLIFYPVNNKTLQQVDIRGITGDVNGKLWLSTNKGLASFDGNEVIYFSKKESDINSYWTSSMSFLHPVMDKYNNLYVVTAAGQTYYFNTKTGKESFLDIRSRGEDSSYFLYPKPYSDIMIDGDSVLWGGRYNMGFIRYRKKDSTLQAWNLFPPPVPTTPLWNTVNTIKADPWDNDRIWLATSNGIYVFHKKKGLLERRYFSSDPRDSSFYDLNVTSLEVTCRDSIWFVAPGKGVGAYSISKGRYQFFPYDGALNHVNVKIAEFNLFKHKSKDEYFVGLADGELSVFNVVTHQYSRPFRLIAEMSLSKLQDFYSDGSGNYWILIAGRLFYASTGKVKFRIQSFELTSAASKRSKLFKTILWDQRKQVYYAVFDHSDGIYVLNAQMKYIRTIPVQASTGRGYNNDIIITDIGMDRLGRIWASSDQLYMQDTARNVILPVADVRAAFKTLPFPFNNLVFRDRYIFTLPTNYKFKLIYRINTETLTYDSIPLPAKMLQESGLSQFGVLDVDHHSKYAYLSNGRVLFQLNLKTIESRIVKGMQFTTMPYAFFPNFHWYCVDDSDNLWLSSFGSLRKFESNTLRQLSGHTTDQEAYLLQSVNLDGKGVMAFYYSTGIVLEDYKHDGNKYKLSLVNNLVSYLNPTILYTNICYANDNLFAGAEMDALQYVNFSNVISVKAPRRCYISSIEVFNKPHSTDTLPEYMKVLKLHHDENFVTLTFSSTAFSDQDGLEYQYKMDGVYGDWITTNYLNRKISYQSLSPGKYTFHVRIRNEDSKWSEEVSLQIIIVPAWWQTNLFRLLLILLFGGAIWFLYQRRIQSIRNKEMLRSAHERELLVLEAKALRAQMNPHFIFNCLNSIKSLIQQQEDDKAIEYLGIFSKLIRTLFNNADKKEISLYDEIETCRLYIQLEALRFGEKMSYTWHVDPELDMKSVQVPALIVQPFIENAIWHGIMPRETGGKLEVSVQREEGGFSIIIDDDGIGREASLASKQASRPQHQSRGVGLTQSRLELDNFLQHREADIEIIDKHLENGDGAGTTVIITFKADI